jgi:hypothetical protein
MHPRLAQLGCLLALVALSPAAPDDDPTIGRSYRVPYRLTETNHYLVRVRINGKGPFNFLVDSGAPALFIGTEAAKAAHLDPAADDYWTTLDRLDIEGGAVLTNLKARIEDPFQLTGMNALGLPGARIHGILGFTILARFRLEFDPTDDRMTWTRIDYAPREPFIPRALARNAKAMAPPPEIQMMQALGPLMKVMAVVVGKQPEDQLHPQGILGIELETGDGGVRVTTLLAGSPAATAGVKVGDQLVKVFDSEVKDQTDCHRAVEHVRPGTKVPLVLRRGDEMLELSVTAGEGL